MLSDLRAGSLSAGQESPPKPHSLQHTVARVESNIGYIEPIFKQDGITISPKISSQMAALKRQADTIVAHPGDVSAVEEAHAINEKAIAQASGAILKLQTGKYSFRAESFKIREEILKKIPNFFSLAFSAITKSIDKSLDTAEAEEVNKPSPPSLTSSSKELMTLSKKLMTLFQEANAHDLALSNRLKQVAECMDTLCDTEIPEGIRPLIQTTAESMHFFSESLLENQNTNEVYSFLKEAKLQFLREEASLRLKHALEKAELAWEPGKGRDQKTNIVMQTLIPREFAMAIQSIGSSKDFNHIAEEISRIQCGGNTLQRLSRVIFLYQVFSKKADPNFVPKNTGLMAHVYN
jgi:hypothetical protein